MSRTSPLTHVVVLLAALSSARPAAVRKNNNIAAGNFLWLPFLTLTSMSAPALVAIALCCATPAIAVAQTATQSPRANATAGTPASPARPSDYRIGVEDVLSVVFWREKDLSAEVVVRPDGKISLPMLNDIEAAGLTPEQLADVVATAALKYVRDPGATVMVKQINSRKVYVIGEVGKPGTFPLGDEMNVLQAIAQAGGFLEHADKGGVVIVRSENDSEKRFKFNYNDVVRGKNTQQNIRLLPGDTILVR